MRSDAIPQEELGSFRVRTNARASKVGLQLGLSMPLRIKDGLPYMDLDFSANPVTGLQPRRLVAVIHRLAHLIEAVSGISTSGIM